MPDLSHAVRTGRISRAQAFVGSLVKIVPVLRIDGGSIEEEARVRTFVRAQDTMLAAAVRDADAAARGARVRHSHPRARARDDRGRTALRGMVRPRCVRSKSSKPVR